MDENLQSTQDNRISAADISDPLKSSPLKMYSDEPDIFVGPINENVIKTHVETVQSNFVSLKDRLNLEKEDIETHMEQRLNKEKENYMNLALLTTNDKGKDETLLTLLHQQTRQIINDNQPMWKNIENQ
jgi:hypothetical protein